MHPQYLNETLIHWTGRAKSDSEAFEALEAICNERILRLSYCPSYVQVDFKKGTSMVCFTEVPLEHCDEHCARFGKFGLAFCKQAMIEYGTNPVLYTTAKHLERIKHIGSLLERMKDLEKDREWRQELEPYQFTEDETVAMLEVMGLLQEYSYKNADGTDYVTYYQREWRLTFNVLPFAGDNLPHAPGMSCFYSRNGISYPIFKFTESDVQYLIVPEVYESRAAHLAKSIGCDLKIYEREVHT